MAPQFLTALFVDLLFDCQLRQKAACDKSEAYFLYYRFFRTFPMAWLLQFWLPQQLMSDDSCPSYPPACIPSPSRPPFPPFVATTPSHSTFPHWASPPLPVQSCMLPPQPPVLCKSYICRTFPCVAMSTSCSSSQRHAGQHWTSA
jgi:hypothetical protein